MSLFIVTNQERPYEQLLYNWFEKRFPQPEIKCTRRIHLESRFNLSQCFIPSSIFY